MSPRILAPVFVSAMFLVSCSNDGSGPLSPSEIPLAPESAGRTRILDLGTLGGPGSNAQAVNEAGQVVGWSPLANGELHGFLWVDGHGMQDLGPGRALQVNDQGVVLMRRPGGYDLWSENGSRSTGLDLSYTVTDMNNHSVLAGQTPDGRAFLWTAESGVQVLDGLGQGWSAAYAVNDLGIVAGYAVTDRMRGGFLWEAGTGVTPINIYPGALFSRPVAMNENGDVAGVAFLRTGVYHAYRWSRAEGFVDVGPGVPASIDRAGNVTGTANSKTLGWSYAFYWTPQTGMTNLHWLAPRPISSFGNDLNDSGMIVGQSARFDRRKTGAQGHATLWRVRSSG